MMSLKKIEKVGAQLVASEDLFLDATQTKVLQAGDERCAFLLARKGQVVPAPAVHALKLTADSKPEAVQARKPTGTEPAKRSTRPEKPEFTR
jgi:hypothetical protein